MVVNGVVKVPVGPQVLEAGFRLTADLEKAEQWKSLQARIHLPEAETEAKINWQGSMKLPEVEVKKGNQVVMDSAGLAALLPVAGACCHAHACAWSETADHCSGGHPDACGSCPAILCRDS